MATANGVGDDELRSGACREESRGGNGVQGKRGEVQGRGEVRGVRGRLGNASVEAGGGRGGIGARHRAASVRGKEDDKGEEVGWAALGRSCWATRWASQVSPGGSALFFIILFCFIFSIFCNLFLI